MKSRLWIIPAGIVLIGCSNPQVIPAANGEFIAFKESHVMGWGNLGNLKRDVYAQAHAFAQSKGKVVEVVSEKEYPPGFGKYASFELKFRLVDPKK